MLFVVLVSEWNLKYNIISSLLSYFIIPLQKGLLQCMLRQLCDSSFTLLDDELVVQTKNCSRRLEGNLAQRDCSLESCFKAQISR